MLITLWMLCMLALASARLGLTPALTPHARQRRADKALADVCRGDRALEAWAVECGVPAELFMRRDSSQQAFFRPYLPPPPYGRDERLLRDAWNRGLRTYLAPDGSVFGATAQRSGPALPASARRMLGPAGTPCPECQGSGRASSEEASARKMKPECALPRAGKVWPEPKRVTQPILFACPWGCGGDLPSDGGPCPNGCPDFAGVWNAVRNAGMTAADARVLIDRIRQSFKA